MARVKAGPAPQVESVKVEPQIQAKSEAEPTTQERLEGRVQTRAARELTFSPLSTVIYNNRPQWVNLKTLRQCLKVYQSNPIVHTIINIKANADANRRLEVIDRKTEETVPVNTKKTVPAKLYRLVSRPNPLQTFKSFLRQRKIFREVFSNTMTRANASLGFGVDWNSVNTLVNTWPCYMNAELTGKYFDATTTDDIIRQWKFEVGTFKKMFTTEEILLQSDAVTDVIDGLVLGRPWMFSHVHEISNIKMAYETRNVVMRNRGMDMVLSSNRKDASGGIALGEGDVDEIQAEVDKYGTLEGQFQWLITRQPVTVTPINRDVRKLGVFDEIALDAQGLCIARGVPEILMKLYLQGATFENQEAAVRRLYTDTVIPEAEEDDAELNRFLKLDDEDFCFRSSFDHVACLQESKEKTADANKKTSDYMIPLFLIGGVTLNQWLNQMDLPSVAGGDVRIQDMEEEERNFIIQQLGKSGGVVTTNENDPNAPQAGNEEGDAGEGGSSEEDATDPNEPKNIPLYGKRR